MKKEIFKKIAIIVLITSLFAGCARQINHTRGNASNTQTGAIIGTILGAVIGASTKGKSKGKRVLLGGAIGAAIGGGIGYTMDQQAKEMADKLNTNVNNNPNAALNPNNDLIVSNTDKYVKIMLRDAMVFETNSAVPTKEASKKIENISDVLKNYPNTIVQVVGFTDSRGSYKYNQNLSERRASNVGTTIFNSGINNNIFSKGCSYNKPIAPNTSKENMALNRRVEIYLYSNQNEVLDACLENI